MRGYGFHVHEVVPPALKNDDQIYASILQVICEKSIFRIFKYAVFV